jgi:glucose/arabinose dehydrogenase
LLSPDDARHRPTAISEGNDGELYVSSTISGRVWKITTNE